MTRRAVQVVAWVLLCSVTAGCVGGASASEPEPEPGPTSTATATTTDASAPSDETRDDDRTVTLAFAGDVHFDGSSARALTEGLGPVEQVLRSADLTVVNLETAVTERGTPAPKKYVFRAPDEGLDVLADAGVSAVSIANNHGMDYGRQGLDDTLAAADAAGLPVLGAGRDEREAYEPLRRELDGVDVSVLAASDVLDWYAIENWVAGPSRPGMASSKEADRLLRAVRSEADRADVVVVVLHWGKENEPCPTGRQRELAQLLSAAGADVVVGSHAHVLLPAETVGQTYVHYGLGNFVWYTNREANRPSGVLTVEVGADGVADSTWHPAMITDGLPLPDGPPEPAFPTWEPSAASSCTSS